LELEKAAKHGAQRSVKIKTPWDSADGYSSISPLVNGGSFKSRISAARSASAMGLCESTDASEKQKVIGFGDLRATESKAYTPCRFGNHIDAKTILRAKHLSAFLRQGARFRQREASFEHAALYPIE
jgi:hypothetical protein